MLSPKEIEQLIKKAEVQLNLASHTLKHAPKGSVEHQINRDIKTACIAEIDILKQVLNG